VISNVAVAAYTGLATLDGRQPTDHLVMSCLGQALRSKAGFVNRLRDMATEAVRANRTLPRSNVPRSRASRTSIVFAGFGTLPEQIQREADVVESWAPFLVIITNAQRNLSQAWRDAADKEFRVLISPLELGSPYNLHVCGQRLTKSELASLHRSVRGALRRCTHAETFGRILARVIQEISGRNPKVGSSVTCVYAHRRFASQSGHPSSRTLGRTNLAVGVDRKDYERLAFQGSTNDPSTHTFLPGFADTPGVVYFPGYVNPQIEVDATVMIHESLDPAAIIAQIENRHSARRHIH
jgi:hypothetical protein